VLMMSVDPGLRAAGYAVFQDGTLLEVGLLRGLKTGRGPQAWRAVAQAGLGWLSKIDELVMEFPKVYPGTRAKGDPADLLELAGVAGTLAGMVESTTRTTIYLPREWKGTSPKEKHQAHHYKLLSPHEKQLVDAVKPKSLAHNALDAVLLGLFHVRKQGTRRTVGAEDQGDGSVVR
jgi:hypothetical protein